MLRKKTIYSFCLCFLLSCFYVISQDKLSGTVKDTETGIPLDGANVVILKGPHAVAFSITNAHGQFSVPIQLPADTLTLYVSMMGYNSFSEKIGRRSSFEIEMKATPIQLKEVTIRPGRVWGRNDTIRYDASRFLRDNDQTIEDLMKRLPGIQVDDDGTIQYKGKPIGTIYVEGLDLMDSRYKSISRTLPPQSVKEIEVLDNHQRIKSLVGKVSSDMTDINLKLSDSFKDRWSVNGKAATGISLNDLLYELEANALQISKKSQSLYALKLSNTGNGITKEAEKGEDEMRQSLPDYRLLPIEDLSSPLKEKRWLFNDAAIATGNRLYRLGQDSRLKINAFYTNDHINRKSSSETTYLNLTDTLTVDEIKEQVLNREQLNISADYEVNATTHFLRNKLDFFLEKEDIFTDVSGSYDVVQNRKNKSISLQDHFLVTHTLKDKSVWQLKAFAGYWRKQQQLRFNKLYQPIALQGLYANAESKWLIRHSKIGQNYTTGASVDFNNLEKYHRLWFTPAYEYLFDSFKFNLSLPMQKLYFQDKRKMLFHPGTLFRTDYKINYAWSARFTALYEKKLGDLNAFYLKPFYTDYRTINVNEKGIPITHKHHYMLRTEYKNTMSEFFVTADIHLSNSRVNHTFEQTMADDLFQWSRHYMSHKESSYGINSTLSKGFFDINTKTSLESSYWCNKSAQIRNGTILPFSLRMLTMKPTITISPLNPVEIAYSGEFQYQSTFLGKGSLETGLWSMNHTVSLSYIQQRLDLSTSVEYYRNEITPSKSVSLLFADFRATYKFPHMILQLQMNNLLNHRNYRYTIYQPLLVRSSQTTIRPREILLRIILKI